MPVTTRRAARTHTASLSSTLVDSHSDTSPPLLSPDQPMGQFEGAGQSPPAMPLRAQEHHSDEDASDDSTASSSASSDSSSSSDSDSDSDDDSDALPTAHLSALLLRAKSSARQRTLDLQERQANKGKRGGEGDELAGGEEVVLFGEEEESESEGGESDEEGDSATPRASTSAPSTSTSRRRTPAALPPSLARPLSFSVPSTSSLSSLSSKGKSRASSAGFGGIALAQDLGSTLSGSSAGLAAREGVKVVGGIKGGKMVRSVEHAEEGKERAKGERWGVAPPPRMSKNALKARAPTTAGPQWFNMPTTELTPALKREMDALRLSAALDPKRFMRQGAKKDKVGEVFQIGHLIAPSTRASSSSSAPTVQKRSFIEDLVADDHARAYASKKTKEARHHPALVAPPPFSFFLPLITRSALHPSAEQALIDGFNPVKVVADCVVRTVHLDLARITDLPTLRDRLATPYWHASPTRWYPVVEHTKCAADTGASDFAALVAAIRAAARCPTFNVVVLWPWKPACTHVCRTGRIWRKLRLGIHPFYHEFVLPVDFHVRLEDVFSAAEELRLVRRLYGAGRTEAFVLESDGTFTCLRDERHFASVYCGSADGPQGQAALTIHIGSAAPSSASGAFSPAYSCNTAPLFSPALTVRDDFLA
ncbi:hypothetical protein JCM10207_006811 [Rhodosporidiobolus poonsookiae]